MYLLYHVATSLAAPLGAAWLAWSPEHRALLGRFNPALSVPGEGPIWLHACSVGEVGTARPILEALRARWPEISVVVTASTVGGRKLADSLCGDGSSAAWFPFDHPLVVRRFLRRLRPRALALVETELWPAAIRETRRAGVPVVLVNGRLSDKHFARYERFRFFMRPTVGSLSAAGMQNEEYAERLVRLGADPSAVRVTGCTKFDGYSIEADEEAGRQLRKANGFAAADPVVVFGSTRPGDEALAALCWQSLRERFPELRIVVAPRHLERLDEALAPFGGSAVLRSQVKEGRRPGRDEVFVLDEMGELARFYGMASVAVIGGSFFPGVEGHNPIEPAALGVPTVFGPYMGNFRDAARVLVEAEGARQVPEPGALCAVLEELLSDREGRAALGGRGRDAVLANQGAVARNLDLLAEVLGQGAVRRCR